MGAQAYMAPDAPCTRYCIMDPGLLGIPRSRLPANLTGTLALHLSHTVFPCSLSRT